MRQLRKARHNIADRKHAGLRGLLRLIHLHKPAIHFDLRLLNAHALGPRRAPHRNQHLLRFLLHRLSVRRCPRRLHARVGLLDLLHLAARIQIDAALLEQPSQFL